MNKCYFSHEQSPVAIVVVFQVDVETCLMTWKVMVSYSNHHTIRDVLFYTLNLWYHRVTTNDLLMIEIDTDLSISLSEKRVYFDRYNLFYKTISLEYH